MSDDCVSLCVSCSWQCFTAQVSRCLFPKTSLLDESKAQRVSGFFSSSSFESSIVAQNKFGSRLSFIPACCRNTLQHRRGRMQRPDAASPRLCSGWSAAFTRQGFFYFILFFYLMLTDIFVDSIFYRLRDSLTTSMWTQTPGKTASMNVFTLKPSPRRLTTAE